jgi:hypothetical protein
MNTDKIINTFAELGRQLLSGIEDGTLEPVISRAYMENQWFNPESCDFAIRNIAGQMLNEKKLSQWLSDYYLPPLPSPKTVAVVAAGNIPLACWHDIMCVLISGNKLQVKLSSKDKALPAYLLKKLIDIEPEFESRINNTERLTDFEAVIATGSNNTGRYFEYYFGKYPHIIRKSRNSIAVLTGNEDPSQILKLGIDVFSYFGLGCRNVSKLYVPKDYDFVAFLDIMQNYKKVDDFFKYNNNYSYNKSIMLLNRTPHLDSGFLLLKEDKSLAAPTAVLHYEIYEDLKHLSEELSILKDEIQCIVGSEINGLKTVDFGQSQSPELWDYADGVDTLDFLTRETN